jgi:hypothetical protein
VKYEALCLGMELARDMGIKSLEVIGDLDQLCNGAYSSILGCLLGC